MLRFFSDQNPSRTRGSRVLHCLAVILSTVFLCLSCSGKESPSTGKETPAIPAAAITASTDSQNWTRYLAYSRPPSETVIIENCDNESDFPPVVTPTLEKIVDNGYRSASQGYYRGGGTYFMLDGGGALLDGEEKNSVPASSDSQSPPERALAEPDIYALQDDLLYTLNIYRGLQAIRTDNPENPRYAGGVYIPGFPNELYLKGDLVISTVAGFKPGYGWSSMNAPVLDPGDPLSAELSRYLEGRVVALNVKNPEKIEVVSELPLPGTLIESRIVGDILYAVTFTPESIIVSSFSLAGAPDLLAVDQEIIPYPASWDWSLLAYTHLYVSPEYLFISVPITDYTELEYYASSDIYCLDVSDPTGQIKARGKMNVPGHIADRFKMDLYNQTFRVVGGGWGGNNNLSIFDLSNPDQPNLLSTKYIGQFEQLFASRFDGERAYIVTYQRKDPLWIIDLSNPENPMVVGELIVPGWSQYIEPLGDRLVTLGVDDEGGGRRASVSLFSVEDPTNPRLLDKVTVGSDYSTSYGFADYKAFKVLPDQNLIMLPWADYQGFWWWGYRMEDQVTLIDLLRDGLKERGSLAHIGTVERPFLSDSRAFILSQSAVQIANIDDRDHPETLSLLRLLRSAHRIIPAGKFALVEDENDWWELVKLEDSGFKPAARVKITGSSVSVLGNGESLYVIRQIESENEGYSYRTEVHRLLIPENGQVRAAGCFNFPSGFYFSPQALIPLGDSLVGLYGSASHWSYYSGGDVIMAKETSANWSYKEGILVLEAPESEAIAPERFIEIQNDSSSPAYSSSFSSGSLSAPLLRGRHLYLPLSETVEPLNYYSYPETVTAIYYAGRLDLTDPENPSLLLVNIPGSLAHVSEDEEKFYYQSTDFTLATSPEGWDYYQYSYSLGACRYDAQGFQAGDEIALAGYPAVAFSDNHAILLSGTPYYYWYLEYSGEPAPVQAISLLKTDDIGDLQVIDSLELPAFEAGYSLNGFEDGRAFISLGPFVNPKRIREIAIAQGSWISSGDEMYAYLDLIYQINDAGIQFEHIHPSTNWNPVPVLSGRQVLVPAGMYGIEVLR